jgi:hypothetical protein
MTTLIATYFLALLWYRFSDYWQSYITVDPEMVEEDYFVVVFGLRPLSFAVDNDFWNFNSTETF